MFVWLLVIWGWNSESSHKEWSHAGQSDSLHLGLADQEVREIHVVQQDPATTTFNKSKLMSNYTCVENLSKQHDSNCNITGITSELPGLQHMHWDAGTLDVVWEGSKDVFLPDKIQIELVSSKTNLCIVICFLFKSKDLFHVCYTCWVVSIIYDIL